MSTYYVNTPRIQRFLHAFKSPMAFKQAMELSSSKSILINEDLAPSPPPRRTWTTWSYFAYWWSESWCVSTWAVGSSFIALGATLRDALLVVFFANLLSAVIIVANGRAASRYHIGYPVLARVSFGIYGQYFVIILRSIFGIIWAAINMYFTGRFISICLRCIFPSWVTLHNSIPATQGITIQAFIGYIIAFFATLPFVFVHTSKIMHLFTIKSIIMPLAGLGIVIWATTNTSTVDSGTFQETPPPSAPFLAWGIIAQFDSVIGINSALLVTVPDLARYSKTPNAQVWGQLFALPVAQTICGAFGILATAAVKNTYGTAYWNPYDLLEAILDHSYTSKARAGVFFASAAFAFATLGTSIACNFIPFAADVTSLLPKYINIIRGQILCLIVAFGIVPWKIVASADGFLAFINGYSIFQFPITAIMVVDYFLIRRGNMSIPDMYNLASSGRYYYYHGWNIRAFVAFVAGFALPMPGFIQSFGKSTGNAINRMYLLGWILSLLMGALTYYLGCLIWKVPGEEKHCPFESQVPGDGDEIDLFESASMAALEEEGFTMDHETTQPKGSE
ncbi:hypothetical protein LTR10_021729 [Elasticomyces elasticus]|uniref:NCS1 nucleoside transporter n=1 Tax=Exophiala sideris TaxID=1016849 RepID=A0ABR0JFR2_9EURO|nr:hypothetical protein LTR10_021729 [Elasticomyces elasticus]KAK5032519.1 hypothetical protein LTS07_003927 [Exophiala sideris]KAK5037302.1 hypothetical protein LTR13_005108 [Exophiala sideris]KAK5062044.1 hypothetical protein LTR69_004401 [Exophiala sideris]KAK5182461.1 hypothetical protein LTR44_005473 [Eurotiomycetes sp. CCFEE 6388]